MDSCWCVSLVWTVREVEQSSARIQTVRLLRPPDPLLYVSHDGLELPSAPQIRHRLSHPGRIDPLLVTETEETAAGGTSSARTRLAPLRSEGSQKCPQAGAVSGIFRSRTICICSVIHGHHRDVRSWISLRSGCVRSRDRFLSGRCSLGLRLTRGQSSKTRLAEPSQQRRPLYNSMGSSTVQPQYCPVWHAGDHRAGNIAALRPCPVTHVSQLVQGAEDDPHYSSFLLFSGHYSSQRILSREELSDPGMISYLYMNLSLSSWCNTFRTHTCHDKPVSLWGAIRKSWSNKNETFFPELK